MRTRGRRLSRDEARSWALTGALPTWVTHPKEGVDIRRAIRFTFTGIDGEGQTNSISGRHCYTLLAASTEKGESKHILNPNRLSTDECLRFLCSFPRSHRFFAYSFGYDLGKILDDVDDCALYRLFRPELRRRVRDGKSVTVPVFWPAQFPRWCMNYLNGRFSVKPCVGYEADLRPVWGRGVVVNDIWRFFQGKFTTALEDWKTPEGLGSDVRADVLKRMREMKDKRAQFDKIGQDEILSYCLDECRYMAELARKLTEAHIKAKIPLKSYFGAGSSASAMLDVMGIDVHVANSRTDNPFPKALEHVIACAFFGGRFENAVLGPVPGLVWSYDISSAYPYQATFLPCLIHGRWEKTCSLHETESARAAVVHYRLHAPSCIPVKTWGPFPFRLSENSEKGSIAFPECGNYGWVWKDEFFAGYTLFPNVEFLEAWVYRCDCDCQPFRLLPQYYRERLSLGKEGPGIVLKLGMNSCYGKLAQFVGGEPGKYTSWMWAGMITSGCRAQLLEAMARHTDLRNMLMVATDGIATRERLSLPIPRNTGTGDCLDDKGKPANKPLGGWEEKPIEKGLFLARPGIYFPLNPTDDEIKKVRARGIGRSVVYEQWKAIVQAYEQGKGQVTVKELSRFIGAKTGVSRSGPPGAYQYRRSKDFGNWISRPVEMSFSPLPKRASVEKNGRLMLRRVRGESAPYVKSIQSEEAKELRMATEEAWEQPDGGDLSSFFEGGDFGYS
jgi:hypothetical protein